MALLETKITNSLLLFNRVIFWEYSEREIPKLGPEFVIPRVTRYGSLEEVIRLFAIYPEDRIRTIAELDRELDQTEKIFLLSFHFEMDDFVVGNPGSLEFKSKTGERRHLLEIGAAKLDSQSRQNNWDDLIDLCAITERHSLAELLVAYGRLYPAMPKKQRFMALWQNLMTPPPSEDLPFDNNDGVKRPETIIASLKNKCIEMGKSILSREAEAISDSGRSTSSTE